MAGSVDAVEDDLPGPLGVKRRDARKRALDMVLTGKAAVERRGPSRVVKIGSTGKAGQAHTERVDKYVELGRENTDKIFVILTEFGDERHPSYPDQDTDPNTPGPVRFDGPRHNQNPQPDRAVDNSTRWQPDYSREHFHNLYFGAGEGVESVKTYYEKQSSGRYSVDGRVTDWVRVRYNQARYGRSNGFPCAGAICDNTETLIRDAIDVWVAGQLAQGKTDQQVRAELAEFDVWDRYDYDNDGDYNEPDHYLDHFQIVHAGMGQSEGGGQQGEDAIWSHRGWVFEDADVGPPANPAGGTPIGNTGLWVSDYTIQPENGGLGVFVHEYAHDLDLPDLYSGSGNQEGVVNWWSIMGQTRFSAATDQAVGTRAGDLGPWEKLQLNWLSHETVAAGQTRTIDLGPHEYNTSKPQAFVVTLPKKQVVTQLPVPPEGVRQWWSGAGDEVDHTLTRRVSLPAGPATLTFKASWDIEDCGADPCDYAYVEVDAGNGFTPIPGSITRPDEGNGIDGASDYVPATFDLTPYAGSTINLRLRLVTDFAFHLDRGLVADDIRITSGTSTVFSDGAENGANGWTAVGFTAVGNSATEEFDHYYIGSHRTYVSYDRYLQSGPFNFGFLTTARPNWVEHLPYQEGLVLWYWDTSKADNSPDNESGTGLIQCIDSHPQLIRRADGVPWRPRFQGYDAPFSLRPTDALTLHNNGEPNAVPGQAAVSTFDDSRSYYNEDAATNFRYGVKVPPNLGVRVRVISREGTSMRVRVN